MAPHLFTIKKRDTFVQIRNKGVFIRSKNINVQKLLDKDLDGKIGVGFTATKKIGNAVKRNKIKRRLRNIMNHGLKISLINLNYSYLLIANKNVLDDKYENIKQTLISVFNKIKW